MGKFVIREVPSGVKFDLYAANGQSILTSEVYTSPAACRKGMESVRKNALLAKIEDQTGEGFPKRTNPKFEIYLDRTGAYRFRLKARNGEIIAVSERYNTRAGCINGVESVKTNAQDATIAEQQGTP